MTLVERHSVRWLFLTIWNFIDQNLVIFGNLPQMMSICLAPLPLDQDIAVIKTFGVNEFSMDVAEVEEIKENCKK